MKSNPLKILDALSSDGKEVNEIYEALTQKDVQDTADT